MSPDFVDSLSLFVNTSCCQTQLHKFRQCLALRGEALQANTGAILASINSKPTTPPPATPITPASKTKPAISLEQMKKLTRVLDELFTQAALSEFPVVVPALKMVGKSNKSGGEKIIISPTEEKTQESDEGGSLLPSRQPNNVTGPLQKVTAVAQLMLTLCGVVLCSIASLPAGSHAVCLHISSVGLKDAPEYVNPHLRIILASPNTSPTSDAHPPASVQDTPHLVLSPHSPFHLLVDRTVHLPLSLEAMRAGGLSCYVEVRHWKTDKKKVSVRCWALLEVDEMEQAAKRAAEAAERDGGTVDGEGGENVCLELYQKPVDFRKKRLNLFSVKKLYLTLSCQIRQQ